MQKAFQSKNTIFFIFNRLIINVFEFQNPMG